jgi:hypothetical protein
MNKHSRPFACVWGGQSRPYVCVGGNHVLMCVWGAITSLCVCGGQSRPYVCVGGGSEGLENKNGPN